MLESGLESEDSPLGALMRLSAELVVQEAWRGRQLNGWEEVTMSAVRKTSL